ncbi:hypothetical protein [Devosia chinhatensis]|uniref:Uncharacterized protein n=1 Tax=Devosia chinhatensis TaxID=429727 RepID=A0A0F5FMG1_9HYPH|nr:hypothetical protein [Devosia chinhatensis]KKB09402.1 hypothetical protein VE26_05545 [Devosia chinhatensis]
MPVIDFPCKAEEPAAKYEITIELDAKGGVVGVKAPDVGGRQGRIFIAEHLRDAADFLQNGAANDG